MTKRYFVEREDGPWVGSWETVDGALLCDLDDNEWAVIRDIETGEWVAEWHYESENFDGGYVNKFGWKTSDGAFHVVRQERMVETTQEEREEWVRGLREQFNLPSTGYITGLSAPSFRKEDL